MIKWPRVSFRLEWTNEASREPDEVLVEGSWFSRDDLPKVLGNFMRSSASNAREAKEFFIRLSECEAEMAELRAAVQAQERPAE